MKNKSIKFEHQSRNDGDLKKGPVLYIFVKRVLMAFWARLVLKVAYLKNFGQKITFLGKFLLQNFEKTLQSFHSA